MRGVVVVRDGDSPASSRQRNGWPDVPRPPPRRVAGCPPARPSSATVYEHLKKTASPGGGRGSAPFRAGDVAAARSTAARTFDVSYRIPYIAHVPLEPRAAVAEWTDGKLTVWTGTQRPFGVRIRAGRGVPHAGGSRPRDRAGHRIRVRRQAHRGSTPSKRRAWRKPLASSNIPKDWRLI